MLVTNYVIMNLSTTNNLDIWGGITLRGGFSIYTGWLTAATILNIAYLAVAIGWRDGNLAGFSEEQLSVPVLWVAFVIYNIVAWYDRNPLYGSIYEWVILAIRYNLVTDPNRAAYTLL